MIHPSWKAILTNPIAKTLAVAIGGALFTALDSVAQQVTTGSVNGVQIGTVGTIAAYFIHNFLSNERDRVFGETAYPPTAPKTIVPADVQTIAAPYTVHDPVAMRRVTDPIPVPPPPFDASLHERL